MLAPSMSQPQVEGFDDLTLERAAELVSKYDLGGMGGLNLDEFLRMVMKEPELKIKGQVAKDALMEGA